MKVTTTSSTRAKAVTQPAEPNVLRIRIRQDANGRYILRNRDSKRQGLLPGAYADLERACAAALRYARRRPRRVRHLVLFTG